MKMWQWILACLRCGLSVVWFGLVGIASWEAHPAEFTHRSLGGYRIGYATYLGGPEWEEAREIVVYPDGSVLIGAQANSPNLPITPGAWQPKYAGDDPKLGHPGVYGGDCYLARISADGRRVVAATYFGGSRQERNVYGMALDSQGNIVITTMSRSPDLPTTPGGFQRKFSGGPSDMVVAKLSADMKRLLWCTYIGGSQDDSPRGGLALDPEDCVYVVGTTNSPNFPTTAGVVQPRLRGPRDSVIVKLSADGTRLVFSTLLGGSGEDDAAMGVRIDSAGNIYIAGHCKSTDFPITSGAAQSQLGGQSDCYLAKLTPNASRLLYATYLGGSGNEFAEHRLWLMPDGCVLLAGFCGSADFPTTPAAYQRSLRGKGDGFLVKLAADGSRFVFCTLVGGSGGENALMPTVDNHGNIWIVGSTSSPDFPVTPDALQPHYGGGNQDGMLAVFSPDGSKLLYATYLGGKGEDLIRSIAFGPKGDVYLIGNTSSPDFPVTSDALQAAFGGNHDAFLIKLLPTP